MFLEPLTIVSIVVLIVALILYVLIRAFKSVGFTASETLVLLVGAIIAYVIIPDVPLYAKGNLVLCFNVAGCLIPLTISARVIRDGRAPLAKCIIGIAVVTVLTYHLSAFVSDKGVVIYNIYHPSLAAAFIGILLSGKKWGRVGPISYVSSSLGILIGCDLLRLNEVFALQPARLIYASIGGAGVFDAIFVAGIIAVALDILAMALARMTGGLR
ncbi:MAG: DUF1614 domain-containing protein [Methanocellales archaeon]|nr:DUF1614 domain-containing protein [Methanocellales archaeon]